MSEYHRKPGVITTVQVLLWISVGAAAILTCISLGVMDQIADDFKTAVVLSLIVTVAGAILNAVIAVQLGARKNWARITGIVLCIVSAILTVLLTISAPTASTCISPILNLVIVLCLTQQDAKDWCNE